MNAVFGLGRYLYAVPFIVFGLFHFMSAKDMAGMVPIPGGEIWVYLTGLAHIAAAVSIIIGKMDKLGTALLGLMLLIFALSIHLPGVINSGGEDPGAMSNFLKDTMLAGAAWMYAGSMAKDNAVIG
ncbi:MAG: DoxX family membrane protein [Saprospiraceae bacterium]|nr:DoxX family membrane protein [Saprospiraceae bacterium]MCB0623157.1 DoxX family membrane protein [Saprospiraceae bacterium]MCB0675820.1 DoxX family membrane protein [Saprospiraceae bacterium]MCB0680478.1 DoxX family membrane protein [Saprospiraceae bacterium]